MSLDVKDYVKIALSMSSLGVLTSGISALSSEVFNVPLDFSPFNIKNVLKVGILCGGTTVVLAAIGDRIKPMREIIREDICPEPKPTEKF